MPEVDEQTPELGPADLKVIQGTLEEVWHQTRGRILDQFAELPTFPEEAFEIGLNVLQHELRYLRKLHHTPENVYAVQGVTDD